jgi:hypothetical protein
MQIEQVFPYFNDVRVELLDRIDDLTHEQWIARFGRRTLYSAEQIVFRLTEQERWWIGHVCQALPWPEIRPDMLRDKRESAELLRATFELTKRYVDTLEPESVRFVRTVPPDIPANRPEENRRIDWILWHVLTLEISALAEINLLTQL